MLDNRSIWVVAVALLCCVPCSFITAQAERMQLDIVATHTVELREVLRVGSLDGPSDAFGRIRSIALDRSNRLYVADDLNHEVRVFDFDGQLVRIIGREGEGPGEFRDPWGVSVDGADTLLVWDQALGRFSVFDPHGVFRRSFSAPRRWLVNSMDFLPGGHLLVAAFGATETWGLHLLGREGELIDEFGTVSVDSNIYPGFVSSLFGGAADVTGAGDIVYTRKSPYELLLFDSQGEHMRTCVGADDWTSAPRDVVSQNPEQMTIHWEQFVHSSGVFAIEGGRYLNLLIDRPNSRTILDVVSPDCRLLCRHVMDEMFIVEDVRATKLVGTALSDIPQVIVFEFSIRSRE